MTAQSETEQRTAVYVYGIIPGEVDLEAGADGVGDPPGQIRLVRHEDLAALVSDVDVSKPLGRPQDLVAHEELLDSSAEAVPVLPLRFGAVVASDDAVASELLAPHHDEFAAALEALDGQAEYVVRGRYDEATVLRETLQENDDAARLSEQIRDTDETATRDARMRLGEIVTNAIEAKRDQDTQAVHEVVAEHVSATVLRPPTHEFDAVHTAYLVKSDQVPEVERALQKLARDWGGRVELRLLGPLAAYDFTGSVAPSMES
ncbi:MAG TPA: GvpL/GvpF family gas vesicle protein [Trebonia sp.]|jgi:hypothetical protein